MRRKEIAITDPFGRAIGVGYLSSRVRKALSAPVQFAGRDRAIPVILLAIACVLGGLRSQESSAQEIADSYKLASPQLNLVSNEVRARLEHVAEFIRSEQWPEAVETLRQIMEDRGNSLIELPDGSAHGRLKYPTYVPLSKYCQLQLASWAKQAPEALALYRHQVDPLAERWYTSAIARLNEAELQRVVDKLFLSSVGDQAAWRLGALALERGNFTLARKSWEQLHPGLRAGSEASRLLGCTPGTSWWLALQGRSLDEVWPSLQAAVDQEDGNHHRLVYPDSDIDLSSVRARLALISILEGSMDRAQLELEMLRRLHPDATGLLAGREGIYHEILTAELQESHKWRSPRQPPSWTTLGGAESRDLRSTQEIDIGGKPIWRVPLPRLMDDRDRTGKDRSRVAESADGLLSYYPAAIHGHVFVHQPNRLRALEIRTGQPTWPLPTNADSPDRLTAGTFFRWSHPDKEPETPELNHVGVPRYCISVCGNYLLTRMGRPRPYDDRNIRPSAAATRLVGIDVRTQKLLFEPIVPDGNGWEFEAAPIIDGERVIVSLRRHDAVNTQARVACYAIDTGRPLWTTDLASGESLAGRSYEYPNGVLTLHDDLVFCNTRLGIVAALRASDGRIEWLLEYPRSGFAAPDSLSNDRHLFRDLAPPLAYRDVVLSAAADCNRILAIDVGLGQLAWMTAAERAVDAVHLLGVTRGRLLTSGDYLYWFDVHTGKLIGQFPSPGSPSDQYGRPGPRARGRGLLTRSRVYWPTEDGIRVFSVDGPQEVRQPIELAIMGVQPGNLLSHAGILLIASADELVAFQQTGGWTDPDIEPRE
jgi:hypothetical protein